MFGFCRFKGEQNEKERRKQLRRRHDDRYDRVTDKRRIFDAAVRYHLQNNFHLIENQAIMRLHGDSRQLADIRSFYERSNAF